MQRFFHRQLAIHFHTSEVPEETAFTTVVRISGAGRNPENMDDLAEIPDSQPAGDPKWLNRTEKQPNERFVAVNAKLMCTES